MVNILNTKFYDLSTIMKKLNYTSILITNKGRANYEIEL